MSVKKIKKLKELKKIVDTLHRQGKKIVFTNGCFDILHWGHAMYLQKAKAKGDKLIVALNSDSSIKRLKGKSRPIVSENDRAKMIAALESVDYVTVFGEDTPLKTIKTLKPDMLVKGSDWNKNNIVGSGILSKYAGKVSTIKKAKGRSTTNLINKIVKSSRK
ncbi:MAG: D-glycero-beta-D-manno-heptose 1-phosphate adenylyltransferase [Candidatus Omnitrophota bacterium]